MDSSAKEQYRGRQGPCNPSIPGRSSLYIVCLLFTVYLECILAHAIHMVIHTKPGNNSRPGNAKNPLADPKPTRLGRMIQEQIEPGMIVKIVRYAEGPVDELARRSNQEQSHPVSRYWYGLGPGAIGWQFKLFSVPKSS